MGGAANSYSEEYDTFRRHRVLWNHNQIPESKMVLIYVPSKVQIPNQRTHTNKVIVLPLSLLHFLETTFSTISERDWHEAPRQSVELLHLMQTTGDAAHSRSEEYDTFRLHHSPGLPKARLQS